MTHGEALAAGRAALAAGGIDGAAQDARLLLAAAAGVDMAQLIARSGDALPAVAKAQYDAYLKRRLDGEPVARIFGAAEFWGLRLKLNAATLVPRPDTETLVEAVLEEVRRRPSQAIEICDLGTGSGAIVIALLRELPEARAVATDISEEALAFAHANACTHGVAEKVSFVNVDFADGPEGPFDIVVLNPPYVRSGDIEGLSREVRDFDPRAALDGGADGLSAYRAILRRVPRLLAECGLLALEIDTDRSDAVVHLCRESGLAEIDVRSDLAGRNRVVTAKRKMSVVNAKAAKKALGKVG